MSSPHQLFRKSICNIDSGPKETLKSNTSKMPEITVKITKGSKEVSNKATSIPSSSFDDLISSLKTAKEETNTALSKIVEESQGGKQTRQTKKSDDDNDDEESSEDDTSAKKKHKP